MRQSLGASTIVQGHADPRTTRRDDRARNSLDQHAAYALAAFLPETAGE